ncbi:O-antigen ligase family protein [Polaribacter aquimarinus]|uniref:O-antigen ligase-related domain-containing protein n=1 Tax=Polaribacter aquimarinus TaxID=2100726 RepID=A0A2U2JB86_9FLAO|nr:O-antigen ligase family protein [Polaribacter aquimarinus]PWG05600.1 hypothetical protein DIS07_03920 [Polaribacter aquimarinus]
MKLLDKYLITSSVFAIFTEDFSFHYIIDLKLFYLILISNFFLISYKYKVTVNKNIIVLFSFFIAHGLFCYLVFQNPIQSLIAQVLGISISSVYFYNLIKIFKVNVLVDEYLKLSFFIAIISIPMFYLGINVFTYNRLNGILSEPAHYAAIMLPATYFFLRKREYLKLGVIVITIFLSKSSVGFIGLFLILIIPLIKIKYFLKYSILVVVIVLTGAFYLSSKWNNKITENESNTVVRRLKQTQESFKATYTGKFKNYTNLSTYAFLSNFFIAQQIFIHKPIGTGLGSYKHEYDKYYEKLSPPKYLIKLKQSKINRTDANSLFLRMIADFGFFGILMIFYFIRRSYNIFRDDKKIFQQSSFFYLFSKLLREGHYFPPEFYFFLIIFIKNTNEDITCS